MIALAGARCVFVDIDPVTYNIDPKKIERAITPRTKQSCRVSLYGQCADFDAINAIARKHNLPVIEDGAQSFGASYRGKRSCGVSDHWFGFIFFRASRWAPTVTAGALHGRRYACEVDERDSSTWPRSALPSSATRTERPT